MAHSIPHNALITIIFTQREFARRFSSTATGCFRTLLFLIDIMSAKPVWADRVAGELRPAWMACRRQDSVG